MKNLLVLIILIFFNSQSFGQKDSSYENESDYLNSIFYASISNDETILLSVHFTGKVILWNFQSGEELRVLYKNGDSSLISAYFNNDCSKVITNTLDCITRIWDVQTGKLLKQLKIYDKDTLIDFGTRSQYSPDGSKIIAIYNDNLIRIWDANTYEVLYNLKGHKNIINVFKFSPDNKYLVTNSRDSACIVWDVNTGKIKYFISKGGYHPNYSAYMDFNNKNLILLTLMKNVGVWDLINGRHLYDLYNFNENEELLSDIYFFTAEFSPDGKYILTTSTEQGVQIWNSSNGKLIKSFKLNPGLKIGDNDGAHFNNKATKIVLRKDNHHIIIWDLTKATKIVIERKEFVFNTARFTPDGKQIFATTGGEKILVFDSNTGALIKKFVENNK